MCILTALLSVYNGERYLPETIESILSQTYREFQFIIVNDGSTDNTLDILEYYKRLDQRIIIYNLNENQGVGAALNFGLSKVRTKYIAKVDSDDLYDKKRFEKQISFIENNPQISVVGSKIEFFTDKLDIIQTERYRNAKNNIEKQVNSILTQEDMNEKIYWFWCLIHSTIMAKTEILKSVGYDKNLKICEDYNLFYKLNKLGYKMTNIDEVLAKIRIRDNSTSASNIETYFYNVFEIKKVEIENILNNNNETYIWGAGGTGIGVYDEIVTRGYNIHGFIDSNIDRHGEKINNVTIYSPSVLTEDRNKNVIVASDPGRFVICDFLNNMGYKHLENFIVF